MFFGQIARAETARCLARHVPGPKSNQSESDPDYGNNRKPCRVYRSYQTGCDQNLTGAATVFSRGAVSQGLEFQNGVQVVADHDAAALIFPVFGAVDERLKVLAAAAADRDPVRQCAMDETVAATSLTPGMRVTMAAMVRLRMGSSATSVGRIEPPCVDCEDSPARPAPAPTGFAAGCRATS